MNPRPAAVARHPHLAEPQAEGLVRVDLHSHTMWSGDSTTTPEEIEEAVLDCGIDVLCVTDHNATKGAEGSRRAPRLGQVIVGEEVKSRSVRSSACSSRSGSPSACRPPRCAGVSVTRAASSTCPTPSTRCATAYGRMSCSSSSREGLVDAVGGPQRQDSQSLNRRADDVALLHRLANGLGG